MAQILGTCSKCGGPVMYPESWFSTIPPKPTCRQCGAQAKGGFGPTIPMEGGRNEDREPDLKRMRFPKSV